MRSDYLKVRVGEEFSLSISTVDLIQRSNSVYDSEKFASDCIDDSSFYFGFNVPDLNAHFVSLVTIIEKGENETIIRLDSVVSYVIKETIWNNLEKSVKEIQGLSSKEYANLFNKNVCDFINKGELKIEGLTIDNKRMYDNTVNPDKKSIEISKRFRIQN